MARIRKVTDKPIRHVLLTHYHAVRGVAGYEERVNVIASDVTRGMIVERGQQDMDSEIQRFPRLFRAKETIPGLTAQRRLPRGMTLWLGSREVQIIHAGRGHTRGDTIAWLPEKVLFAGDLVEFGATPIAATRISATGRARSTASPRSRRRRWCRARRGADHARAGRPGHRRDPRLPRGRVRIAKAGVAAGHALKQVYDTAMRELRPKYGHWVIFEHCMPFDVSRAYDEAQGIDNPRIWTAERDIEMWRALESGRGPCAPGHRPSAPLPPLRTRTKPGRCGIRW